MRGLDYQAHRPLDQLLRLDENIRRPLACDDDAERAWSATLGGLPVVLVRSVERARQVLLETLERPPETPITVPANVTNGLLQALKRHGARPRFSGLSPELGEQAAGVGDSRVVWAEPVGGLTAPAPRLLSTLIIDYADTLPEPGAGGPVADALLWGLHLEEDDDHAGALIAFAGRWAAERRRLHDAVRARLTLDDLPDPGRTVAQLRRLAGASGQPGLAQLQRAALFETRRALLEAAGLPLLPPAPPGVLSIGVGVRVPEEADAATFYAYVRGENTPTRWLPEARPVHHTVFANPDTRALAHASAGCLSRLLLVPVGPEYSQEEIAHAVLGVVKAAEHLGVRWRTDPEQAGDYARMMTELYGPDHDAYRPVFATAPRHQPLRVASR